MTLRAQQRSLARLIGSLALLTAVGCGDEIVEVVPECDDIGWPLGLELGSPLPAPEFAVECAEGWGSALETRPALDTTALPGQLWMARPHPAGGWIMVIFPEDPAWARWLEQRGYSAETLPPAHVLLWVDADGELGWIVPEYGAWMIELVGEQLWVLAWDAYDGSWLLAFDPSSGELLDARPWDLGPRYNRMLAARDPAGGVWFTAIEAYEGNPFFGQQLGQHLYRATALDAIELVATRTTEAPLTSPSGYLEALPDGAAAWGTGPGFEIIEADGEVRWSRDDGRGAAADLDTMLIVSGAPTGVGAGRALRLEKISVADGATLWTREHQRFVVSEPEACGTKDCYLSDFAYPMRRPEGGYLLVGHHAYPSADCSRQPLVMAVSSEGDAQWAHRVDTCGRAWQVVFRDEASFELLGINWDPASESDWSHTWIRTFAR